jgi:hypothetical protein
MLFFCFLQIIDETSFFLKKIQLNVSDLKLYILYILLLKIVNTLNFYQTCLLQKVNKIQLKQKRDK